MQQDYSVTTAHSPNKNKAYDLVERFHRTRITLIPLEQEVSIETIIKLRRFPHQPIAVCDFRVKDMERIGVPKPYGFYLPQYNIHVIDHHGRGDIRMERWISSGNLANFFLDEHGPFSKDQIVVAHHFDCDSIISSSKVRGILPREQRFDDAVIAADHSGVPHPIADLLTALEDTQLGAPLDKRYLFSLRNLELLLNNEPIGKAASDLVAKLKRRRALAKTLVEMGKISRTADIFWGLFETNLDPELLLSHLPSAKLIVTMFPMSFGSKESSLAVRIILGQAAPEGFTLTKLNISSFDSNYGGRWNRGSNRRGGGTTINPSEYIQWLEVQSKRILAECALR